ncbi:arrestin n-terminal domain containing protein [Grosmannia clavigera kw1407]|uniref:Arrestin n-terminal domain containing protein n=1 Tax=Grosmannia clavigera (strain kw1407 / UAMH 11150) TaxID=655863 RepID=F0XI42_GROCL|nr:arrestin n-terminal domain containing protein [Grosmannia clavigera kw1407]EFX02999.1 arrestin n-terminal domain containing protein [Grosmannia clavigera kw1407]
MFANLTGSLYDGGSSSSSTFSFGASTSRRSAFPKTNMEVLLDNHFQSRVYTTGDSITGSVRIVTQRDVPFDAFEIVLLGASRTQIDAVSGVRESSHILLKMAMPIAPSAYPVPRVLETGQEYVLPFRFVVPAHLTLGACNHVAKSDRVRDHHVCLPPTMGDGAWERDDMTPDMARVKYVVRARIFRDADSAKHGHPTVVAEATQSVRILPAGIAPDDDELFTSTDDNNNNSRSRGYYTLSKSKSLRKGLLMPLLRTASSKLGCVHATVTEPATPVILSTDGQTASPTAARVSLRFDPTAVDVPPPRITAVSAKLLAHTYFSLGPIVALPNPGTWSSGGVLLERACYYDTSVSLLSRNFGSSENAWEPQVTTSRRDSGYCSDGSPNDDDVAVQNGLDGQASKDAVGISYTTDLLVPLQLPADRKTFLPTFHSCIVSRTYSLQLSVSVAPSSTTSSSRYSKKSGRGNGSSSSSRSSSSSIVGTTTITLTMPIRIIVGSSDRAVGQPDEHGLPSFDAAMEEAEADAFLMPRMLEMPDARFQETSVLPGYGSH